jgi:putative ABC transport system substrate-binding protein
VKRRAFLALCAGASISSAAAGAEQKSPLSIGFLSSRLPDESASVVAAFLKGLARGGYSDGQNVTITYRWAEGRYERLPELARDLVNSKVDVIAAIGGPPSAKAAKAATDRVPVVFVTGDPVGEGLVDSLAHPGSNLTGLSVLAVELSAKRLEILSELVPRAHVFALLVNPTISITQKITADVAAGARQRNVELRVLNAANDREIDAAFIALPGIQADGLIVGVDPYFDSRRDRLVELAARSKIPAIYWLRDYALSGGLVTYGPSLTAAYSEAGAYVARILEGEKPRDLPVQQPSTFELVLNAKTARSLNLAIPPSFLARADEVID